MTLPVDRLGEQQPAPVSAPEGVARDSTPAAKAPPAVVAPALVVQAATEASAKEPASPELPALADIPAEFAADIQSLADDVVAYDPRANRDWLLAAGRFACLAHATQKRDNGEPYFIHPIAVARILVGFRLDSATIATALLHDVVEDTGHALSEIQRLFGAEVARLVDGVTKLTRLELQSERTKQAENLRKLVLAMSEDIRVLLVKLADRLHNMRTLRFVPQLARRQKTARETIEIYAPLAERIGMDALKTELETLSFRELNPEAWQTIGARLNFLRGQGADLIEELQDDLKRVLAEHDITSVDVMGREKSPYSIWLKMQRKNVAFEQLSDIMAFRVIVDDKADCYAALGAIHSAYRVVPGRFKDYISTPKTNGYQSLHTGVTVPSRRNAKIEVQIRTPEMHEVAEYGVAAHWIYKQTDTPEPATDPKAAEGKTGEGKAGEAGAKSQRKRYPWVKALLDILDNAQGAQEFLEHTKLELHRDQVFCFTPKGDLIELPRGATPIDFAYDVHSQVGDTCVGAKVNGKIVPLRSQLENGDQVEIITARGGTPNPAWEHFVVTGKAKARIRRFVHARQRQEHVESGRATLAKAFRQEGLDFSEKQLEPALKPLKQTSFEDLYAMVGAGNMAAREVVHAAVPELRTPPRAVDAVAPLVRPRGRLGAGPSVGAGRGRGEALRSNRLSSGPMPVTGLVAGMAIHFAGCCHPLRGDRIVGIVSTGKGVTIHAADCHTLSNFAQTPERFIDVDWDYTGAAEEKRIGRLNVLAANDAAVLATLTNAVAKQNGVVSGLRIMHRSQDFCEVAVDVEVEDLDHLSTIMAGLRACSGINQVTRARG